MDTDASVINIAQVSGQLEEDLTYANTFKEDDLFRQAERPKNIKSHKSFNVYSIIAAALVFISIIAVFEILRLYMEHVAATDKISKEVLYDRTIGQIYYAMISIVVTIIVIIFMKHYELI